MYLRCAAWRVSFEATTYMCVYKQIQIPVVGERYCWILRQQQYFSAVAVLKHGVMFDHFQLYLSCAWFVGRLKAKMKAHGHLSKDKFVTIQFTGRYTTILATCLYTVSILITCTYYVKLSLCSNYCKLGKICNS